MQDQDFVDGFALMIQESLNLVNVDDFSLESFKGNAQD